LAWDEKPYYSIQPEFSLVLRSSGPPFLMVYFVPPDLSKLSSALSMSISSV